jgi:hypothetical protein
MFPQVLQLDVGGAPVGWLGITGCQQAFLELFADQRRRPC